MTILQRLAASAIVTTVMFGSLAFSYFVLPRSAWLWATVVIGATAAAPWLARRVLHVSAGVLPAFGLLLGIMLGFAAIQSLLQPFESPRGPDAPDRPALVQLGYTGVYIAGGIAGGILGSLMTIRRTGR